MEPISILISKLWAGVSKRLAGHPLAAHHGMAAPASNRPGPLAKASGPQKTVHTLREIRSAQRAMSSPGHEQDRTQRDLRQATTQTTRAANAIRDAQRAIERAVPPRARPGRAARFGRIDTPGRGFGGR